MSAKSTSDSTRRRGLATKVLSQLRGCTDAGARSTSESMLANCTSKREREQHADERDPRIVENRVEELVAPSAAETTASRTTACVSDNPW